MFPRSWGMQVCDWYLHPHSHWLLSSHNNMCVYFYRNGAVRKRNTMWFALQIRKLSEGTARGWERCTAGSFTWADLAWLQGGKELGSPSNCLFAHLFLQHGTDHVLIYFPCFSKMPASAHSKVNDRFAVDFTKPKTFLALGIKGCNKHLP